MTKAYAQNKYYSETKGEKMSVERVIKNNMDYIIDTAKKMDDNFSIDKLSIRVTDKSIWEEQWTD